MIYEYFASSCGYFSFPLTGIKGVDVFLEKHTNSLYVGRLTKIDHEFVFTYNYDYLNHKTVISLGPEFPLTQQEFSSKELFPSFMDRIPDKDNPAYDDYCTAARIACTVTDPFILLSTIGRKGPSSFIFFPVYRDRISFADCELFRKQLGLTYQDFAKACGISLSGLQKIRKGQTSGIEILRLIELFIYVPEAFYYQLQHTGKFLHSRKIKQILANHPKLSKAYLTDDDERYNIDVIRWLKSHNRKVV